MIHLKVQKGTVNSNTEDLCTTCHHAVRIQYDLGEARVHCSQIEGWTQGHKVVECSGYADKRLPSLSIMNRMAWVLRTDGSKKNIGFVPSKEYYKDNKDEDVYDPTYTDPIVKKIR